MNKELAALSYQWWVKLAPLCKKFAKETYLNGYNQEDLMQECYLQLMKCLEKYDSSFGVPFESYYKIQLYGWRANQNRKKRDFLSQKDTLDDEVAQKPDEGVDIEKQVENKLLMEAITKELSHMKSEEQTLVIGYYLQNKSLKALATAMDIKYKKAEFEKTKAIQKLRQLLESDQ